MAKALKEAHAQFFDTLSEEEVKEQGERLKDL
jgi:hypothetical protein